ncbi:hypothetical protein AWC14_24000 [Mycobacterium kyorinense]|uniref:Uncharacterized protein n=1 Tax=Mycobacterium kyorinense TaxID=487514 RepID=A0A1X1Y9S7_9MYCO|nr:hypothetical protein AWC14_24000 [Mycobacterium kyorinense]
MGYVKIFDDAISHPLQLLFIGLRFKTDLLNQLFERHIDRWGKLCEILPFVRLVGKTKYV